MPGNVAGCMIPPRCAGRLNAVTADDRAVLLAHRPQTLLARVAVARFGR